MGVDISWRAFDDEEVELMWSEYPLGELISLVEGDKLFRQRHKSFVPEETLNERKKHKWEAKGLLLSLHEISKVADDNGSLFWNVKNGLVEHVSQSDLLELDEELINYFTYLEAGNRFSVYADATTAMYEAKGMEFHENDLLFESMTPGWLSVMRETEADILTDWMARNHLGKKSVRFPPITEMKEIRELAELTLQDINELVGLFDFAEKHGLPVYVSVGELSYELGSGIGEQNLVVRFEKRFCEDAVPACWKKLSINSQKSGKSPKDCQKLIAAGKLFPTAPRYCLYIMHGDKYHNVKKLAKTRKLKKAMESFPQLKSCGTLYELLAHGVTFCLPCPGKGCGIKVDFPLLLPDAEDSYDQAMEISTKLAQLTRLNLYDPQISSYVDTRNLSVARKRFLEYAEEFFSKADEPASHVPRWRGKKWPMVV